jgi:hypothetical protein
MRLKCYNEIKFLNELSIKLNDKQSIFRIPNQNLKILNFTKHLKITVTFLLEPITLPF